MSDTQKKAKQPTKRKSVKGARRVSSSASKSSEQKNAASANAAPKSSASKSSAPKKPKPKGSAAKSTKQTDSASSVAAHPQKTAPTQRAAKAAKTEHPLQKIEWPWRRLPRGVVACVLVVCVLIASIGVFVWDRWFRYDDAADIQGSWIAEGTQVTIEIDETSIQITEDVAYEYSLNTSDKTITFTFGDMSGSGVYSFSNNRNTLVIEEQASVDIVADFLAFYHLDILFGLGKDVDSQDGDADETDTGDASQDGDAGEAGADETEDDGAGDDGDETSSSDEEGSLSLTLTRVS